MRIINSERTVAIVNNQPYNVENPGYLYELLQDGAVQQRHGMINQTLVNELAKKGLSIEQAKPLGGFSFHNLCISVLGPYMTTLNGEQVYTFRNDHTLVKLDPGMKHPEVHYHVAFPKDLYSCITYEKGGAIKSIEYLAILNNGAIRFQYKYTPTNHRMTVLSAKELPDDIKKHLLHNVGQQGVNDNVEQKGTNNPAIGIKLLLDLLDEVETNGDTINHQG